MALPQLFRAIRQSRPLKSADGLWDAIRPGYDSLLRAAYGHRGMPLRAGGRELLRVDPACRSYIWEAQEEETLWTALMTELRPGDRFADVGANIGVYTVAAARRGAFVTSFEPNPRIATLLRRNIALNKVAGRVEVREVALAANAGETHLAVEGTLGMAARVAPSGSLAVRAEILSEAFDVVKIDVEGHELEVLRGASPLLADMIRRPRAVFLELHVALFEEDYLVRAALEKVLAGYDTVRIAALGASDEREHWLARART
jgi:FkbM family methyltransferase